MARSSVSYVILPAVICFTACASDHDHRGADGPSAQTSIPRDGKSSPDAPVSQSPDNDTVFYHLIYHSRKGLESRATESQLIAETDAAVQRLSDTVLVVRARNGVQVRLADAPVDAGSIFRVHDFHGRVDEFNAFIVRRSFYEWEDYLLFFLDTGDTLAINELPSFSPSRRLFATSTYCPAGAGSHCSMDLDIYRIVSSRPRHEFRLRFEEAWGAEELHWVTDDTLELVGEAFDASNDSLTPAPARLVRESGQWRLVKEDK